MTNRHYLRHRVSDRVELSDILKEKKGPSWLAKPLSSSELRELENHLQSKKLLVYDGDLDLFKEER